MAARIALTVNGTEMALDAEPEDTLLDALRNRLGLRGTRFGCGTESCGACMVLVDGAPAFSCTRTLDTLDGRSITTIEGLGTEESPHPLQRAFLDEQAGQCGYCLSGIIVSAAALLQRNRAPDRAEIAAALEPHLCRCGAHNRILRAVARAAAEMGA